MTKARTLLLALALSGCDRVVDLTPIFDGGILDARGPGIDVGFVDTGGSGAPDGSSLDAPTGIDAGFVDAGVTIRP